MLSKIRQNYAKFFAIVLTLTVLISLIPLFAVAPYDRPALDDFTHGRRTHEVFESTGSVAAVLVEAVRVTIDTYFTWQGSFTDIFLSALQPGLFGERFYVIEPILSILFFLAGSLYFFEVFLHRLLKLDRVHTISAAMLHLLITMQLLPSPSQGFYWHCSTCAYVWMYSLTQLLAGLIVQSFLTHKKRYAILTPIVAFFTAGCNFSTVLLVMVLFIAYLVLLALLKRKERTAVVSFIAFSIGFLISILAPGNGVRMAEYGHHIGAIESIVTALLDSLHLMVEWTSAPFVLLELLTLPFLYPLIRRLNFSFRFPFLPAIAMWLLVACGLTPLIYGYGEISQWAGRVFNLLFFLYAITFEICLAYFVGWIRRVVLSAKPDTIDQQNPIGPFTKHLPAIAVGFAVLILVCGYSTMRDESFYSFKLSHMSSVSAFFALKHGEAAGYAAELDARLPVLRDASITDPRFPPLVNKPFILYVDDISANPGGYANLMWADYFHKNTVALTH